MRTHIAVAAGAALCLLVGACGSVPAGSEGQRPGADTSKAAGLTSGHGPATAAGNKELATAEAMRLLSLVPLPSGAAALSSAQRSLLSPFLGTPEATSLVVRSRSWRVPLSYAAAVAWLAAHRPAGLRQAGVGSSQNGPGQPVAGRAYPGPANPAWQSAELQIEVAPAAGGASVMRADGQVVWLDPVPVRDTATGKRLRILASGRCPASDRAVVGVTNHDALSHALVPAGEPGAGLECSYYGANGHPFRLHSQQRLTAAAARRVAASMARRPLSHAIGEVRSCPLDDGSAELIALSYPGQPDVDLWEWLNGCGGVSNGYIEAG